MLRQDFRDDYLAWVAREYAQNRDLQQAQTRLGLAYWKKEPVAVLEDLAQRRGGADGQNLQALAQALKEAPAPTPSGPTAVQRARPLLQICGIGLLAAALAALLYFALSRLRRPRACPVSERAAAYRQVEPTRWEEEPLRRSSSTPPTSWEMTIMTPPSALNGARISWGNAEWASQKPSAWVTRRK